MLPLALLIQIFPVIDNTADGRVRLRRNFHQVKTLPPGDLQGFKRRHYANLAAFLVDQTNFPGANSFIDSYVVPTDK